VMTQVDLSLTSVSRFDSADPVISVNDVNKNLGRHKINYNIFTFYKEFCKTEFPTKSFLEDIVHTFAPLGRVHVCCK
jgi:hypothetical protein